VTDPGGVRPPLDIANQPFQWQGKRLLALGLYDSRARVWSTDLGAFLQPDEYVYLSRAGTLWSWPGQNPFRWRDPSGRLAGEEWYYVAQELGPYAAPLAADIAALALFADSVNDLGAEIFAQQDANLNAIARAAARDNEGKPNPGEPCKAENSGGGAKGPPAAKGDVAAAPDPKRVPGINSQFGRKFGEHMDPERSGYRSPEEYRNLADEIFNDPSSKVTRYAQDAARYAGETHYERGGDLLRLDPSGNFRSLYPIQ